MKITKAGINEDGHYEIEFLESLSDEHTEKIYTLRVEQKEYTPIRFDSKVTQAKDIQETLLGTVKTKYTYLASKEDRALFFETARFIFDVKEMPVNVKMVNYPGSAIILLEFGTLGITEKDVLAVHTEILYAVTHKQLEVKEIERPEIEEPEQEVITAEDEPFPLGGVGGEFVDGDDDPFNLGVVEPSEEEGDNNG